MLQNLLDTLEVVKGDTENIRIAQGKYYLPETFKGAIKQIKTEIKWQEK